MGQTQHTRLKKKAAGPGGKIEVKLPGGRRLDAMTVDGEASEVERSGKAKNLQKAIERLEASGAKSKVLKVPHKDIEKATKEIIKGRVSAKVKNLSGTRVKEVRVEDPSFLDWITGGKTKITVVDVPAPTSPPSGKRPKGTGRG